MLHDRYVYESSSASDGSFVISRRWGRYIGEKWHLTENYGRYYLLTLLYQLLSDIEKQS